VPKVPAPGPRQVIDDRIGGTGESRRKGGGSVAFAIDRRKAGAVLKRNIAEEVDAAGDRNIGQTGAMGECGSTEARNVIGDRDARQAGAVLKCIIDDKGNAAGDRE
jgi:hypothetical protein